VGRRWGAGRASGGASGAKVAVILDSSRAFPREHLKFKPLTTSLQCMYYRYIHCYFRCSLRKALEESKITAT
jgi:hypothetical protein